MISVFQKVEEDSIAVNGAQSGNNQTAQADSALVNGSHSNGQEDLIAIDSYNKLSRLIDIEDSENIKKKLLTIMRKNFSDSYDENNLCKSCLICLCQNCRNSRILLST